MPKQSPGDDSVGRMQFLLACAGAGSAMPAVLRAMDEVPREHFVEARFRRQRLCRPGAADRLRPDHQPALCGRLHDRAARRAGRSTACSRSAPARATRPPSCRGSRARWSASSAIGRWRKPRASAWPTLGYDNVDVRVGRRPRRRPGAGAVRPHHRHRGRRDGAGGAGRAACRRRRDGAAARSACRATAAREAHQGRAGDQAGGSDRRAVRAAAARTGARIVTIPFSRR